MKLKILMKITVDKVLMIISRHTLFTKFSPLHVCNFCQAQAELFFTYPVCESSNGVIICAPDLGFLPKPPLLPVSDLGKTWNSFAWSNLPFIFTRRYCKSLEFRSSMLRLK